MLPLGREHLGGLLLLILEHQVLEQLMSAMGSGQQITRTVKLKTV